MPTRSSSSRGKNLSGRGRFPHCPRIDNGRIRTCACEHNALAGHPLKTTRARCQLHIAHVTWVLYIPNLLMFSRHFVFYTDTPLLYYYYSIIHHIRIIYITSILIFFFLGGAFLCFLFATIIIIYRM